MTVAVVNCGIGNLSSVRRGFEEVGASVLIAQRPSELENAERIVLPGVGAFSESMEYLHGGGWVDALNTEVHDHKKPLLGICLGMQLLADCGYEGGEVSGLGFVPGEIQSLDRLGCDLPIPHVGWNEIAYLEDDAIIDGIPQSTDFYFAHSYAFVSKNKNSVIATVPYGVQMPAVIRNNHIFGCQFHPEKSSRAGRQILRNFLSFPAC